MFRINGVTPIQNKRYRTIFFSKLKICQDIIVSTYDISYQLENRNFKETNNFTISSQFYYIPLFKYLNYILEKIFPKEIIFSILKFYIRIHNPQFISLNKKLNYYLNNSVLHNGNGYYAIFTPFNIPSKTPGSKLL
jgi:hypothetical protein